MGIVLVSVLIENLRDVWPAEGAGYRSRPCALRA